MSTFPVTKFELDSELTLQTSDFEIKEEYYMVAGGSLGEFQTYNMFYSPKDRLTYDELLEVVPNYKGKLSQMTMNKLLGAYHRLTVGLGSIVDGKLTMINPTTRNIGRWAVFRRDDLEYTPVKAEIISGKLYVQPEIYDVFDALQPSIAESNSGSTNIQEPDDGIIRTTINCAFCEDWFSNTLIIDVPGDGKCGAYAMMDALSDVNISVDFDALCNNLETRELRMEQNRPSLNGWWSAEVLREYAVSINVRLLIKDVSLRNINYWWTTNESGPIIALWANGTHYQWCKKINRISTTPLNSDSNTKSRTNSVQKSVSFTDLSAAASYEKNGIKQQGITKFLEDNPADDGDSDNFQEFDGDTENLMFESFPEEIKPKLIEMGFTENETPVVPKHLIDFLTGYNLEELSISYEYPPIEEERKSEDTSIWPKFQGVSTVIPKRMENALIPLPIELVDGLNNNNLTEVKHVHPHLKQGLQGLQMAIHGPGKMIEGPLISCNSEIGNLKLLCRQDYGFNTKIVSEISNRLAKRYTEHEFSIITENKIRCDELISTPPEIMSYNMLMNTLRHLLVQNSKGSKVESDIYRFEMKNDGRYLLEGLKKDCRYKLIGCGPFFYLSHESVCDAYVGTATYLDYTITYVEVIHMIQLISCSLEYNWIKPLCEILVFLAKMDHHHNEAVCLMRSFEGLCLALSDLHNTIYANWTPIISTVNDCRELCNTIDGSSATLSDFFVCIYSKSGPVKIDTLFKRLVMSVRNMTGNQLQEASSVHKFLFYAEVDYQKGMNKFLERVHTKRPVDKEFIRKLTSFAKRQFVLSYINKHGEPPKFREETAETMQIHFCVRNNATKQLEQEAIEWWAPVIPFDCLTDKSSQNVLEVAKDKGALLPDIRFAPGDSKRELLQVIESNVIKYGELDLEKIPEPQEAQIIRQRSERFPIQDKYPTRLIAKEKEQKVEGRLFGNASLENKHGLSFKMLKAKKALSYFESELMTKTDKARKMQIHDMSQELLNDDTFAMLLDIEGHNQSMQLENCGELYEFVGLLFGESNWHKLAHYFTAQTVYMYDEFFNDVIVSRGQLGGIEGWYNPLWTLHTTLMVEMLPFETVVPLQKSGVYSDDVACIIKLDTVSSGQLNSMFDQTRRHFLRAGMIIRLSQTALSFNRMTILRNHYYKGRKSDSTLKRLLACSNMNNGNFISEELEVAGICSTISSSLEHSEHILTACYIKWHKIVSCTVRLFAAYFEKERTSMLWNCKSTPEDLKQLLYFAKGDQYAVNKMNSMDLVISYLKECKKQGIVVDTNNPQAVIIAQIQQVLGSNANLFQLNSVRDLVYHVMINREDIQDLMFLLLVSPVAVGGKGASLLINDILSGHSDGFFKQLHYIHQWIGKCEYNQSWIRSTFEHLLRVPRNQMSSVDTEALCTMTWPPCIGIKSATSRITLKIKNYVMSICNNREINALFRRESHKDDFLKSLVQAVGKEIQPRILQFYAETSVFYMLDLLIKKIETSSGFCSKIPRLHRFRISIAQHELMNLDTALKVDDSWLPTLGLKANMLDILTVRRNLILKEPITHNVEEPLYDHILTKNQQSSATFLVIPSSLKLQKDGKQIFRPPVFGNEALYKGEFISEESHYGGIEEFLCAKLCSVTRWLLLKNNFKLNTYFKKHRPSFANLCDLSLSTLVPYNFENIFPYIPLVSGGEIFHRLPNMRYKTSAVVRSLPSTINHYTVSVNQKELHDRNLEDSNIHFDYIAQRIKLDAVVSHIYAGLRPVLMRYTLEDDPHIADVSGWKCTHMSEMQQYNWTPYSWMMNRNVSFNRISYIAMNYLTNEDAIGSQPKFTGSEFSDLVKVEEEIILSLISQYYSSLSRNKLTLGLNNDPINSWVPLIDQCRSRYNLLEDETNEDAFARIKAMAINAGKTFQSYTSAQVGNEIYVEARKHLADANISDLDYINTYRALIDQKLLANKNNNQVEMLDLINNTTWIGFNNILMKRIDAISAFIRSTIITHCSCFEKVRGIITLNESDTKQMYQLYITKYIYILQKSGVEEALKNELLAGIDQDDHVDLLNDVISDLTETMKDFKMSEIRVPGVIIKPEPIVARTIKLGPNSICEKTEYYFDRVGLELFGNFEKFKKLLQFMRYVCNLYAHPAVFESPTGSDSYSCQYALFKTMLSTGLLNIGEKVIDATGGRGDGHVALTRLGVEHSSYTRKDIFTVMNFADGMIFKDNYDIMNPMTLDFLLNCDMIHIDISWVGKKTKAINDTIVWLMEHGKKFTIRLNSLDFGKLDNYFRELAEGYRFLITIPSVVSLFPYQIYLIAYPTLGNSRSIACGITETTYYTALTRCVRSLVTLDNLLYAPSAAMENSISILINSESTIANLCHNLLINVEYNHIKSLVKNAVEVLDHPEYTLMPNTYYDKCRKETSDHLRTIKFSELNIDDGYGRHVDVGGKNVKKRNFWIKMINLIHQNAATNQVLILDDECSGAFRQLMYDIPSAKIRGKLITLDHFMRHFNLKFPLSKDQIAEISNQYSQEEEQLFNTTSIPVRNAILILYYAASINNYAFGVLILWLQMRIRGNKSRHASRTLEVYRKLAGLFHKIREEFSNGNRNNDIFQQIKITIIHPIIESVDTKQYLQTRIDKVKSNVRFMNDTESEKIQELFMGQEAQDRIMKVFEDMIENKSLVNNIVIDKQMDAAIEQKLALNVEDLTCTDVVTTALGGLSLDLIGFDLNQAILNMDDDIWDDEAQYELDD